MTSQGTRTRWLEREDWLALHQNGVAKIVGNRYDIDNSGLTQVLTAAILGHQVESMTEFESDAITMDVLMHTVCGLPQRERVQPADCYDWIDPVIGFEALLKSRLGTMYSGQVQAECMARSLVLVKHSVRRQFTGADTGVTTTKVVDGWACTADVDVMARCLIEPEIKRRVGANKKRTLNALEQVRAVPEAAARIIAGQDSEMAAVQAVRQRTYNAAVAELDPAERKALDASISAYTETYLAANADALLAIAEDQPSHLELESSGS